MSQVIERLYTPPELKRGSGMSLGVILRAIDNGALRATNQNPGGLRPRWKVSGSDWQAFLDSLSNQAPPAVDPPAARQQAVRKLDKRSTEQAARRLGLKV